MSELFLLFVRAAFENGFALLIAQRKLIDVNAALIAANERLMALGEKPFTPDYLKKES